MKTLLVMVCLILLPGFSLAQTQGQPTFSKAPQAAEEVAIYRAFLSSYSTGLNARINLSDVTEEFNPDKMDIEGCLRGLVSSAPITEVHRFSTEFSGLHNIRLVDAKTHKIADPGKSIRNGSSVEDAVKAGFEEGVLTVSEISFDSKHRLAVFKYDFYCGALCGNGGTVIFELHGGKWVRSKLRCSSWIS